MKGVARVVYLALGTVCLVLGAVGSVLPVLPTTPFLLVTLFCFTKASLRFRNWFANTNLYKKHLEEYDRNRAMTRKTKALLLSYATTMLLVSFVLVDKLFVRMTLVAVGVCMHLYFYLRVKTIDEKERKNIESARPNQPSPCDEG